MQPGERDLMSGPTTGPAFREALRLWARLGFLSFGGAAGQIAMMHRMIVEEKKWVEERPFLDMLNFCTLLPGPEAQQLATFIGWRLHGIKGGLAAGIFFVIPGAAVMLALSFLYVAGQGVPWIEGMFFGIKAAVLCIVIEALLRIGRRALVTPALQLLAITSFVVFFMLSAPFPLVIGLAALIGGWAAGNRASWLGPLPVHDGAAPPPAAWGSLARTAMIWIALWAAPVLLAGAILGWDHILAELGLFFSKLAMLTFGGAYAVLAWLSEEAVLRGWLSASEMIDGLGLAETTPGPTILVNQFAGFLAAWRAPAPFSPWLAAALGAAMTVWVTFTPSFLWIFAGAPFFESVRRNRKLRGALMAITAVVSAIIATLALRFCLGVLFGETRMLVSGWVSLPVPVWHTLRWDAAALTMLAALLLFRLHRGVIETIAWLAGAGMLWRLFG
jgi:chromate transporter